MSSKRLSGQEMKRQQDRTLRNKGLTKHSQINCSDVSKHFVLVQKVWPSRNKGMRFFPRHGCTVVTAFEFKYEIENEGILLFLQYFSLERK